MAGVGGAVLCAVQCMRLTGTINGNGQKEQKEQKNDTDEHERGTAAYSLARTNTYMYWATGLRAKPVHDTFERRENW